MIIKKHLYERIRGKKNLLAIYTLLSKIKNKDNQMIDLILTIDSRADYIKVERNGEENSGKIIYVIREMDRTYGFFAEFRIVLSALYYAEKMGFVPRVEWGSNFAYYEPEGVEGIYNAFEYYFEPINTDIDISKCYAVTYCKMAQIREISIIDNSQGYIVSEKLESILTDILKRYIHIRKDLLEDFEKQAVKFFEGKSVVGIHYRGTDFKCGYNDHPVLIQKEQIIKETRELILKYNIEIIFLATDDLTALKEFKEEFGDRLKLFEDIYRGTRDANIAFSESNRENHHYRLGLEVLRDVYMLSKCDYLISGLSQVSLAARMFKKSRDEEYVEDITIDNGINKGTKEFGTTDAK